MNRIILFKAKRVDNCEWVEGKSLIQGVIEGREFTQIEHSDFDNYRQYEVKPETICQFTGLLDKNGNKIFEGDYDHDGNCVVWCNECNGFEFSAIDIPTKEIFITCYRCDGSFFFGDQINDFEITGNIHD